MMKQALVCCAVVAVSLCISARTQEISAWLAGDTCLVYPDGEPSWRFPELKKGVVAAEKVRLLRARGLFAEELDTLAKRFDVKEANVGKANFKKLRDDVIATVNK